MVGRMQVGGEECCRNVGIRHDHIGNEGVLLIYHVCRTSFEGEWFKGRIAKRSAAHYDETAKRYMP